MLGLTIANAETQTNMDFNDTLTKIEGVVNQWQHHTLTLMGKILLIKSVYKISVLPLLSDSQTPKFEDIVKKFFVGKQESKNPPVPTAKQQG